MRHVLVSGAAGVLDRILFFVTLLGARNNKDVCSSLVLLPFPSPFTSLLTKCESLFVFFVFVFPEQSNSLHAMFIFYRIMWKKLYLCVSVRVCPSRGERSRLVDIFSGKFGFVSTLWPRMIHTLLAKTHWPRHTLLYSFLWIYHPQANRLFYFWLCYGTSQNKVNPNMKFDCVM